MMTLERTDANSLTPALADCLEAIDQAERMSRTGVKITAQRIADELKITQQSADALIQRLRNKGHVALTTIALTTAGRAYIETQS